VIRDKHDTSRGSDVVWWLLRTLGRRHGEEPKVLAVILPTLHGYLVDADPLLRARALDAWVDVGVRHHLTDNRRQTKHGNAARSPTCAPETPRRVSSRATEDRDLSDAGLNSPRPNVVLLLSEHVARWPSETIVSGDTGEQLSLSTLNRSFRMARARIGGLSEGFRYHDLRHYFASLLIASGADVKAVQARLRRTSAVTTLDTYGHLWPDSDEFTRAAVSAVLQHRATAGG
jgi:hypothetical protein